MTRDTTRDAVIDGLADKYGPRALALLSKIRDACRDAGMSTDDEPYDTSADDYRWSISVWRAGVDPSRQDDCIDVSIEIAESAEYDGEQPYGVNFGLSMVEYGGLIFGALTPYNFTRDVWVDARDSDAVEERWKILEDADISEIPGLTDRAEN